jgi:hypothetical protein
MKIRLVGGELSHTDRQADRYDEANSCFSRSCEKRLKSYIHTKKGDETCKYCHSRCIQLKVKVSLSLPTPWRHMGRAETFLTSVLGRGEWTFVPPAVVPPDKQHWHLWNGRPKVPQKGVRTVWRRKNFLDSAWNRNHDHLALSLLTVPTVRSDTYSCCKRWQYCSIPSAAICYLLTAWSRVLLEKLTSLCS